MDPLNTSVPVVVIAPGYQGHAIARSLGRRGTSVYGVHADPRSPAARSRYWKRNTFWNLAAHPSDVSLDRLLQLRDAIGGNPILLPADDGSCLFVAGDAKKLKRGFLFPNQPTGMVRLLSSKQTMRKLCKQDRIPTPQTFFPRSREDVPGFLRTATFHIIPKGIDSVDLLHYAGVRLAIVYDRPSQLKLYNQWQIPQARNLMLQKYIPGPTGAVWRGNLPIKAHNAAEDSLKDSILSNQEPSNQVITDHYRCPEEYVRVSVQGGLSDRAGFFKFGPESVCYGKASAFRPSDDVVSDLEDALQHSRFDRGGITLPFDLAEIVSALRREKYVRNGNGAGSRNFLKRSVRAAYYAVRPVTPVSVRKHLQRYSLRGWDKRKFPRWPVDTSVESAIETALRLSMEAQGVKKIPFIWFWPEGAQACAVMTHDVEAVAGRDFCGRLMDIDDSYGIKSAFQVVPEQRYDVPASYLEEIRRRGFEVGVHDLNHDGNLFKNYAEFRRRAAAIERYRKIFGARGFRAGVLYRNIDWLNLLHFEYDMSVPNVGHLDPQHGGCCTTFPYFVGELLEIPVTMTQDYTLFNILRNHSLDLWATQMDAIRRKHGVINFIVHPDYIINQHEQSVYRSLLDRLAELRRNAGLWIPLPAELNAWWRQRSQMQLVKSSNRWEIAGDGRERARIAHVVLEDDGLVYVL